MWTTFRSITLLIIGTSQSLCFRRAQWVKLSMPVPEPVVKPFIQCRWWLAHEDRSPSCSCNKRSLQSGFQSWNVTAIAVRVVVVHKSWSLRLIAAVGLLHSHKTPDLVEAVIATATNNRWRSLSSFSSESTCSSMASKWRWTNTRSTHSTVTPLTAWSTN